MKEIQRYFGGEGKIDKSGKDRESFSYTISSRKAITTVVLPHFYLYPLITQKKADYELFKRIIEIMNNQEHLTDLGLKKIINHRASLNLGLSEGLKIAFPNTKPVLIGDNWSCLKKYRLLNESQDSFLVRVLSML